ncbi:MAG: tetratricopeptide repeat protein [Acidobacteriota bacterium]
MRAMTRTASLIALGTLFALVMACTGPQGRRSGTGGPVTETGAPVSERTMESFADAYQQYQAAKAGGLDAGECSSLAAAFQKVSDQVESGLPEALFNIGAVWEECSDHDKARQFFEQANSSAQAHSKGKAAGFAPALIHLGIAEYRQGRVGPAKAFFEKARDADRRSEEAYTALAILRREQAYDTHKSRGISAAAEDYREAQTDLRRALAVNSDYMTAFAQMALLYLQIAEDNPQMLDITELVCQQATGRARSLGDKVRATDVAPIHNIWGLALIRKGDVVRAVDQFDAARTRDPNFFEAHMNFGAVNLSFRGFEAAADAFQQAIRLRPEDYEAHISYGAALRGLERYDEARAEYEKARTIDPSRPQAYYNLAVLMQDYELSGAGGMDAQIGVLTKAKTVYRDFLQKCQAKRSDCVRRRPGMEDEDMAASAEKRIKACDETISGLREAQTLAAEAERMTREAEAAAGRGGGEAAPPGGGGDAGAEGE